LLERSRLSMRRWMQCDRREVVVAAVAAEAADPVVNKTTGVVIRSKDPTSLLTLPDKLHRATAVTRTPSVSSHSKPHASRTY
jgi:hypothetical protein